MANWPNDPVVITGANGGLGQGLVNAFAGAGANVIAVARGEVREPVDGVEYRACDLLDEESVAALFSGVGTPWAVINTVGGFAPKTSLTELDISELGQQHSLNLVTAALVTKYALRAMEPAGEGRIIHTASRAATATATAGFSYSVSKAGVLHLVKMAAQEFAKTNIRIHAVSPAIIDTPANRAAMPGANFTEWARPEDIAHAYMFLAAPESPAKSGSVVRV